MPPAVVYPLISTVHAPFFVCPGADTQKAATHGAAGLFDANAKTPPVSGATTGRVHEFACVKGSGGNRDHATRHDWKGEQRIDILLLVGKPHSRHEAIRPRPGKEGAWSACRPACLCIATAREGWAS
ncbi:hypothetical protein Misp03_66240 [Microbispora sp. NBRC 16548]|nr:hypothetical protein Misp03_66240 [Microbispora sp. NBRC 16548]